MLACSGATIGGIFTVHVPFSASSCSTSSAKWSRFTGQCGYYVGLEALAWTLCKPRRISVSLERPDNVGLTCTRAIAAVGLMFVWFVMIIADVFMTKRKRHYLLGKSPTRTGFAVSLAVRKWPQLTQRLLSLQASKSRHTHLCRSSPTPLVRLVPVASLSRGATVLGRIPSYSPFGCPRFYLDPGRPPQYPSPSVPSPKRWCI